MRRFYYKAKTKDNRTVKGIVEAMDEKQAVALLREKNFTVISLNSESLLRSQLMSITSRVGLSALSNFTRQLSTMVNAGVTLIDALTILERQNQGAMQSAIKKVRREVEGGKSLSEALAVQEHVFDHVYVSLIKAGESGGVLDKILLKMAESLEKKRDFQSKVRGALLYPVIILLGMVGVIFIMMVYVIPQLSGLYQDFEADLPTVTAILIKVSDFMSKFWWLFIAVFPLLFLAWKPLNKNPQFRRNFETFLLATPVIGPLWEQIMMTTITRTLSLLVSAGVPIVESLQLCSGVTSSRLYEESIIKSARLVEKGFSLAQAFANQTVFPTIVEQMLSVGEETGQVDQLLERISIYFETESEQKVKNLTTAVEPIILIMLGGGVGFLVFAIIMPIYNLTTTL